MNAHRPDTSPTDMAAGEAVVVVQDLVAGYLPGVNILNGCSIEARQGELIGIIGPNGAGKSTLLKAMFGLVKVHSGTVVVRGQDLTGLKANKLVSRGHRLRSAEQQRLCHADHRREHGDGHVPAAQGLQGTLRLRRRHLPRSWPSGARSGPGRSPVANARWWPWAGP